MTDIFLNSKPSWKPVRLNMEFDANNFLQIDA